MILPPEVIILGGPLLIRWGDPGAFDQIGGHEADCFLVWHQVQLVRPWDLHDMDPKFCLQALDEYA